MGGGSKSELASEVKCVSRGPQGQELAVENQTSRNKCMCAVNLQLSVGLM